MQKLLKEFLSRFKEGALSILPIAIIVIILNFIPGLTIESSGYFGPVMVSFLISIIPMILGMTLFNIGAEKSTGKIGTLVGTTLTKRRSLVLLFVIALLMGILATLAEPDLKVLAERLYPGDTAHVYTFIIVASVGVGVFLLIAILRVVFDKRIKYWLCMGYGLVFAIGWLSDPDFFSVMFDAGGVTTGPVTVPFILSLGVGVASVLGGSNAEDDSFGFSGLCSLGTVLAVSIFSVFIRRLGMLDGIKEGLASSLLEGSDHSMFVLVNGWSTLGTAYGAAFLENVIAVGISVIPILAFFLFYDIVFLRLKKKEFLSILIGLVYVYVGLVLFLSCAEAGMMSVAYNLGNNFASGTVPLWEFILVGLVLGIVSMLAEPAVHVLAGQVNDVSGGVISRPIIFVALCLSTGGAIVLNIIRTTFNIDMSIFVIILFVIALTLAFISPEIYVNIAIDSAGVATGTMASCFFLPLFIGYSNSLYNNDGTMILRNGFGIVGIMSLMPIIGMELVGIGSVVSTKISYRKALKRIAEPNDDQIVHVPV